MCWNAHRAGMFLMQSSLDLSAWECCLLSMLLRSCHQDAQGLQMQSVVSLRCHVCGEQLSSPPYRPA